MTRQAITKLAAGDIIAPRTLMTMNGRQLPVPDSARLQHIQFRRFAGCPICNLHLRSFVTGAAAIDAAGVDEIVVFHSTKEELLKYENDLPFAVIPDPAKELYREFGVESAARAIASPRVWLTIPRAMGGTIWGALRGRNPMAPHNPTGGPLGLPADFLVAPGGRIVAVHYGTHAYDQWSVDELLAHATAALTTL